MRAYKGLVQDGKIILAEGTDLPEGAVVTITLGETEYLRAKVRASLSRKATKRSKARASIPVLLTTLE
ncbi:MAG: hypothetical protein ACRCYY_03615 [Trueperaceae bacterium]